MSGAMLTALIGAYEPGPRELRALTPVAGATLVEHQARRAIAAGAERAVLLVETLPPGLATALARLREDGLAVSPAEGIDAAADLLSDTNVLLIADACLPETGLLGDLADARVPAVATLADRPDHSRYERIDADARWAGVALIDGHRVAATAAMLGSWDPVSTLLRRAVQEGAQRIVADAMPPLLLVEPDRIAAAEQNIIAASRMMPRAWPDRFIHGPIEDLVLPPLLQRGIGATLVAAVGAGCALAGGLFALAGWLSVALGALLVGGAIKAVAARLGRVQSRPPLHARWLERAHLLGAAAGLFGLTAWLHKQGGQWGWWLVAAAAVLSLLALEPLARLARRRPLWIANVDALLWAMVPFALAGRWAAGAAGVALYAGVSAGWLLWQVAKEGEA